MAQIMLYASLVLKSATCDADGSFFRLEQHQGRDCEVF